MTNNDLTPNERDAFEKLPREKRPSDLLEERTVAALRKQGMLRAPGRRTVQLTGGRLTVVMAASFALLAVGFGIGRWTGVPAVPTMRGVPALSSELLQDKEESTAEPSVAAKKSADTRSAQTVDELARRNQSTAEVDAAGEVAAERALTMEDKADVERRLDGDAVRGGRAREIAMSPEQTVLEEGEADEKAVFAQKPSEPQPAANRESRARNEPVPTLASSAEVEVGTSLSQPTGKALATDSAARSALKPAAPSEQRFAGLLGGTQVNVWGPESVVVTRDEASGQITIRTRDALIVLKTGDEKGRTD